MRLNELERRSLEYGIRGIPDREVDERDLSRIYYNKGLGLYRLSRKLGEQLESIEMVLDIYSTGMITESQIGLPLGSLRKLRSIHQIYKTFKELNPEVIEELGAYEERFNEICGMVEGYYRFLECMPDSDNID